MALYATEDPYAAFKELEKINFTQHYSNPVKAQEVQNFVDRVLGRVFTEKRRNEIINSPNRYLHVISVRNRRLLNGKSNLSQLTSLALAATGNLISPALVPKIYPRVIVSRLGYDNALGKSAEIIPLTSVNLPEALIASGTIPLVMQPTQISGGKNRWYWDGAITDYHFSGPFLADDGLILYPHFSSEVIPGWLDKPLPWRKPGKDSFKNVVMLVPSDDFISNLPYGKIPDRHDFTKMNDRERHSYWKTALSETNHLVSDLHNSLEKDKGRSLVEKLNF